MKRLRQTQLPFTPLTGQASPPPVPSQTDWYIELPWEVWGVIGAFLVMPAYGVVPRLGTLLSLLGVSRHVAEELRPVILSLLAEVRQWHKADAPLYAGTKRDQFMMRYISNISEDVLFPLILNISVLSGAPQLSLVISCLHLVELEMRYCWFRCRFDSSHSVHLREHDPDAIPYTRQLRGVMYFNPVTRRAEYAWRANDLRLKWGDGILRPFVLFDQIAARVGDSWHDIDSDEAAEVRARCFSPMTLRLESATLAFVLDRDHIKNVIVANGRLRACLPSHQLTTELT